MDFSVKIEGLDRIGQATQRMRAAVVKEILIALEVSGRKVEGDAKRSIKNGQKSGRTYKRGNVIHQASAPGEAPATDTGRLDGGIRSEMDKANASVKVVALAVPPKGKVNYAYELEFGNSKVAARPFLFPALEKNKGWIVERLNKAVRTAAINASKK